MSYPTCLLTLWKCLFYSDLPQTTINKAINDLRKRLNARVLTRFGHFAHIAWTRLSRLIWHNFVKVGDNCIKICNLAYIRTHNGCVKNRLKILSRLWKNEKNQITLGGIFFDSHCRQRAVRQSINQSINHLLAIITWGNKKYFRLWPI